MKLERLGPTRLRATMHAYEAASMIAAVRWAAEGGGGELSPEARTQLRRVLESWDLESDRLRMESGDRSPPPGEA